MQSHRLSRLIRRRLLAAGALAAASCSDAPLGTPGDPPGVAITVSPNVLAAGSRAAIVVTHFVRTGGSVTATPVGGARLTSSDARVVRIAGAEVVAVAQGRAYVRAHVVGRVDSALVTVRE